MNTTQIFPSNQRKKTYMKEQQHNTQFNTHLDYERWHQILVLVSALHLLEFQTSLCNL